MNIKKGTIVEEKNSFNEEDINLFAKTTGDFNPLHTDIQFAENSMFKDKIVHGMLVASTISKILGTKCPGPGTIYLSQTLKFLQPVKINESFTTRIELIDIIKKKRNPRFLFKTTCINEKEEIILEGEALVINPNIS